LAEIDSTLHETDFAAREWQAELRSNIKTIDELKQIINLTDEEEEQLVDVVSEHPMNIPRYYLSLIDLEDANDPIRKLAIPTNEELVLAGSMGETTADPYGDDKHDKGNGILHKYPYSALIVATEHCSMYCRHCFRKRMVGLPNDQTVENFEKAAEYIAAHEEITNVIISGGDPLTLPTPVLRRMLAALEDIEHINFVRIGSRTPVVFPTRFYDDELIELFREFNSKKALYLPTHFNHANEITPIAAEAVLRVRNAGVTVNNQAVLLKGINDSVEDLVALMNGMVRIGINPYYLYQCMPVSRVRHHFQVPLREGVDIVAEARKQLDGYAKRFKFIIADDIGKVEVCGRHGDNLVMNQIHTRPENPDDASRIIIRKLTDNAGWFDDLEEL
jgi:KamA family protein